jgi:hypothetical protein
MASKDATKDKDKDKKAKSQAKPDKAPAKEKPKDKEKPKAKAKEAEAPPPEEKPKAAPRPPADPRLKFLKKFHGKFLPRGPLRDRHKALMDRWNSGEDHGGVTVDELKALYTDWRAAREKPTRTKATV